MAASSKDSQDPPGQVGSDVIAFYSTVYPFPAHVALSSAATEDAVAILNARMLAWSTGSMPAYHPGANNQSSSRNPSHSKPYFQECLDDIKGSQTSHGGKLSNASTDQTVITLGHMRILAQEGLAKGDPQEILHLIKGVEDLFSRWSQGGSHDKLDQEASDLLSSFHPTLSTHIPSDIPEGLWTRVKQRTGRMVTKFQSTGP